MKYRVVIPPSVEKEFKNLPWTAANRLYLKIIKLEINPRPSGVKPLAGGMFWRIRSGDYRIIFEIDDKHGLISLSRVRHRKDAYRGL